MIASALPSSIGLLGFSHAGDEPTTSIARALRAGLGRELNLVAFGSQPIMPSAWMPRLFQRVYRIPPHLYVDYRGDDYRNDDKLLECLLERHRETRFDALIPGSEHEARAVARLAERLAAHGIGTLLPRVDRLVYLQRTRLAEFLYRNDFPSQATVHVPDIGDLRRSADQLGYPLLVKGLWSGCERIFSGDQGRLSAQRLQRLGDDTGWVLERPIDGERFDVALVAGADGVCRGLVTLRRLAVNENDDVVCGAVVDDPAITDCAFDLLQRLDWRGPLEIGFVRAPGSKRLYVCDVRCRLPAWSMLTHWAGCNLAVRLVEVMLDGGASTAARARSGTMFVRGVEETVAPVNDVLALHRRGTTTPAPVSRKATGVHRSSVEGLCVAVTGTSSFDVINPGLGVARSLRETPGIDSVIGLTYGTFDSGAYQSGLFDATYQLPAAESPEELLVRLEELHGEHPMDVIIPCLDGELPRFIAIAPALEAIGIRTLLPSQAAFDRRSKLNLFAARLQRDWGGFEMPHSRIVSSKSAMLRALQTIGLPAVLKGPVSHCVPIDCEEDANAAWDRLSCFGMDQAIMQPRLSGDSFAVATVCGRDHRALVSTTIKKLAICQRGSTWSALHVRKPELEASLARLLAHIDWVGPAEGEFIRDELTDRYCLIEINPRFTAWIYYSAALGSNHPQVAVRSALGDCVNNEVSDRNECVFMRGFDEIPLRAVDLAALSLKGCLQHG